MMPSWQKTCFDNKDWMYLIQLYTTAVLTELLLRMFPSPGLSSIWMHSSTLQCTAKNGYVIKYYSKKIGLIKKILILVSNLKTFPNYPLNLVSNWRSHSCTCLLLTSTSWSLLYMALTFLLPALLPMYNLIIILVATDFIVFANTSNFFENVMNLTKIGLCPLPFSNLVTTASIPLWDPKRRK